MEESKRSLDEGTRSQSLTSFPAKVENKKLLFFISAYKSKCLQERNKLMKVFDSIPADYLQCLKDNHNRGYRITSSHKGEERITQRQFVYIALSTWYQSTSN